MAHAPFGPDTLEIPVFLAQGDDDPALAAWKREHPDWFVAGTWTARPPPRPPAPPVPSASDDTGRFPNARDMERLATIGRDALDPSTLTMADFSRAAQTP